MTGSRLRKIPRQNVSATTTTTTRTRSSHFYVVVLPLVLLLSIIGPLAPPLASALDNNDNRPGGGTVSTRSNDVTTTTTTPRGESAAHVASGYEVAQTLDFAKTAAATASEAVNKNSSSVPVAVSNGHQNGMLLMAMLLDNKSYIESSHSKPAIALFDFNPEDIQDLDGNDFYSVGNNGSTEDNDVEGSRIFNTTTTTDPTEESLWNLAEPPLTMPLVMKTNGQMLPGSVAVAAAVASMSNGDAEAQDEGTATTTTTVENGEGNIYKVKLRTDTKKRGDRHRSISSQMNILGNEVTTIKQFQTLTAMFDHWQWEPETIAEHVSKKCAQDMRTYLTSLQAGELWALKGNYFLSPRNGGGWLVSQKYFLFNIKPIPRMRNYAIA